MRVSFGVTVCSCTGLLARRLMFARLGEGLQECALLALLGLGSGVCVCLGVCSSRFLLSRFDAAAGLVRM